jgi:protein-disulfide isomerase
LITVKVFGTQPPCVKCKEVTKRASKVAAKYPGKIEVIHLAALSPDGDKYGIVLTPTVVVNEKVVSVGKVISEDDIEKIIKREMEVKN